MLFDNDMNTVLDVFIEKYGYLPTRHGYVPANAGARKVYLRLVRRARRARKNLVMYKLVGRRPWNVERDWHEDWDEPVLHDALVGPEREYIRRTRSKYDGTLIMDHLRERSGFLAMSRLATRMTGKEGEATVREAVIEESKRWRK